MSIAGQVQTHPPAQPAPSGHRPVAAWISAGLLTALAAVLCGFAWFVSSVERSERDPDRRSDAIVALTGGAQRIEDALDLLARGYGDRLLITGVNARIGREEIKRLSPKQRELVECCVDLDYRALNTVGNAREIRRWARAHRFRSLIVVTSNYHLPRALAELEAALPDIRKTPYAVVLPGRPDDGWGGRLGRLRLLASEYAKLVAVTVRNWLLPSPAGPAETRHAEEMAALP